MLRDRTLQFWTAILSVIVTLFYVFSFYQTGLFFSPVQTYVMTGTIGVGLVFTIALRAWRLRMPVWILLGFSYATYTLLTTLWSADADLAVQGSITIVASILLALLGTVIPLWSKRYVLSLVSVAGAVLYLLAIGTVVHWWSYNAAVAPDQNGNLQMNSIFQYHNTFGSFELMAFILTIGLVEYSKKWWQHALYIMCGAFCTLGVVSSYSREVWILLPVSILIMALIQRWRKHLAAVLLNIVYMLFVAVIATPVALQALAHAKTATAVFAILTVVILAGVVAILHASVPRVLPRKRSRYLVMTILGAILVVVLVVLVQQELHKLGTLTSRLGSIQLKDFTVQQRLLFYQAALHIWKDVPLFGSGWGTWTAKFLAYQQYPYQTTMAHSVVMDNLINGGIIGFVLWLGTVVVALGSVFQVVRKRDETSNISAIAGVAALTMLLHGAFDFDFSYSLITATFFFLLGMGVRSRAQSSGTSIDETPLMTSGKSNANRWTAFGSPFVTLVMGITSCVALVVGTMLSVAQHAYYKATVADANLTGFNQLDLQTAIKWAPYYADAHAQLALTQYDNANISHSQSDSLVAWQQAKIAAGQAPWNPQIQQEMATIAYHFGFVDQAYVWSKRAAVDSPFHIEYPTNYMGIALWTTVIQYKQNPSASNKRFQLIVDEYQTAKKNVIAQQQMTFGYHPDWTYAISAPMQVYAGAADYALGRYQQSLDDIAGLEQKSPDANTLGMYQIVTYLDKQHLVRGYKDPTLELAIASNPTFKTEYGNLAQIPTVK